MSVSIEEIKNILINSYSIMYGNIDTKYVVMTRFFEKAPGEFDYTCEVLIPQIKSLQSVVAKVEEKLDEIETFNNTKAPGAPSFVEQQLTQNIVQATKQVTGNQNIDLFETDESGQAVVKTKTFGNPSKSVSKKRKAVVNVDNVPPIIESFDVNTTEYLYRESVSETVNGVLEVFRRVDGSTYQIETGPNNNQTTTELSSAPDPTFVGYEYHGFSRSDGVFVFSTKTLLDSFVRANITDASFSSLSGTVETGVVNTTDVYVAVTAEPELPTDESTFSLLAESQAAGQTLSITNVEMSISEAMNAVHVHLIAVNDPFQSHDTIRLEREGFDEAPYIRVSVVDGNVEGTVFSSVHDIKHVYAALFLADVDVNRVDLGDFVKLHGNEILPIPFNNRYTVIQVNEPFQTAFANLDNVLDTVDLVVTNNYNLTAVIMAEDSAGNVQIHYSS